MSGLQARHLVTTAHLALAALAIMLVPAVGQPVRDRILEDVGINGRCLVVTFSFPLRYVTHYPPSAGEELRIRLRPIRVGSVDRDALPKRETVVPRLGKLLGIDEVLYEGDIDGGPYLTVRFIGRARYRVREARDFRGLVILVKTDGDDDKCRTSP